MPCLTAMPYMVRMAWHRMGANNVKPQQEFEVLNVLLTCLLIKLSCEVANKRSTILV